MQFPPTCEMKTGHITPLCDVTSSHHRATSHNFSAQLFHVSRGQSEVKVAQLCPTLCNLMDYTVHGILQARIQEWVAFPFSRGSSQSRDQTKVSHIAGRFFTCCATSEAQEIKRLWRLINNGNAQHRHFWFFLSALWRVGQCTEYSVTSLSLLSGW